MKLPGVMLPALLLSSLLAATPSPSQTLACSALHPELTGSCKQVPYPDPMVTLFHYNDGWSGNGQDLEMLENIKLGVTKAMTVLSKYGTIPPIQLIYTNIVAAKDVLASTSGVGHCKINVYQNLLSFLILGFYDDEKAQQAIAHEVAHCLQNANQLATFGEDHHRWWMEGSADFLSNMVYPRANIEHIHAGEYDVRRPLHWQINPYATAIFFQSLVNFSADKDMAVMRFIRSMRGANQETMVTALSAFPEIDRIFHKFGQELLDSRVRDTSGDSFSPSPSFPTPYDIRTLPAQATSAHFISVSFVPYEFGLQFPPGGLYRVKLRRDPSVHAKVSFRKDYGGRWTEVTAEGAEIEIPCGHSQSLFPVIFVSTSTDATQEAIEMDLDIEYEALPCSCKEPAVNPVSEPAVPSAACQASDEAPLNECLVGDWKMDTAQWTEAMKAVLADKLPRQAALKSFTTGGDLLLHVDRNKSFEVRANDFRFTQVLGATSGGFTLDVTSDSSLQGLATGRLTGVGKSYVIASGETYQMEAKTSINGTPMPLDDIMKGMPSSSKVSAMRFQCSGDIMTLSYSYDNAAEMTTLFHRNP